MGKDNVLEYPKLDNEIIKVTGFLNLKSAKMKTGKITVLIGEQASGKSILAKLQYFFWKYQSDLFDKETISKKTMDDHNKSQIDNFLELFSVTSKKLGQFKIEYKSNGIEICLECIKSGHKLKITTSPFLKDRYTKMKKIDEKHSNFDRSSYATSMMQYEEEREAHEKIMQDYEALSVELAKFSVNVPDVLYVPASRSLFLTIEDNIFAFLARGNESLDPLIVQFGKFYELAKRRYQKTSEEKAAKNGTTIVKDILKGEFIQENDKDIIRSSWGDVELRNASSGQKEALPLILSLLYFATVINVFLPDLKQIFVRRFFELNNNQLIIIEEPEANLFPTAQKRILEEIVKVSQERGCLVLIATHSPYILSCLNKEIHQAKKDKREINVRAYYARKQKLDDIYDTDDDLIDLSDFDETSTAISNEFIEALDD